MLSFGDSLDREAQLHRLPDLDLTGDHGDDDAEYQLVATVPCRIELTDDNYWTVWIQTESVAPEHEDMLVFGSGLSMYLRRIKPFTSLDGTFHHYECMGIEDPDDERFASRA